jgi:hypothetical protein
MLVPIRLGEWREEVWLTALVSGRAGRNNEDGWLESDGNRKVWLVRGITMVILHNFTVWMFCI